MIIEDLLKYNEITLINEPFSDLKRTVNGLYTCDLLSHAMSHLKPDDLYITILSNVNVIAVATLMDVSAVIIADGMEIDKHMLEKANNEGIALFTSKLSAVSLIRLINA